MVVVAITAILASVSMPAYTAYVQRSRVPPALVALLSYQVRMEQRFQDMNSYANGDACAIAAPAVAGFTVTCALSGDGSGYTATASGTGAMAGYKYTINDLGTRVTVAHPRGVPSDNCWSIRGATCEG
jgi:type IV pilus assembly protein PilE